MGTDDDSGMTSLADVDLYDDVPRHIRELRDLGRSHPFLFYRKLGYVVNRPRARMASGPPND